MEGFGLPAVEAMACGLPVVSSRAGSLPEVIGDAGLYFDPTDVRSVAWAIETIISDQPRRDRLARRALERSAHFCWDRAAQALLDCFGELKPPRVRSKLTPEAEQSEYPADFGPRRQPDDHS
jgi:glycosyltransferase involved in cell wall biosynthesis